ncbi:MAG: hypothetical protein K2G70_07665 [Turicibacter sp.]|nr:hypothetical protein [Turicibacter sp.]
MDKIINEIKKIDTLPVPCDVTWNNLPWSSPEGFSYLDMLGKFLTSLNDNITNTNLLIDNDKTIEQTLIEHDKRITKNYEDNVTQAGTIQKLITEIDTIKTDIVNLNTEITNLTSLVNSNNDNVISYMQSNNRNVNNINTNLENLTLKVNELYENLENLTLKVNELYEKQEDITDIRNSINNYRNSFIHTNTPYIVQFAELVLPIARTFTSESWATGLSIEYDFGKEVGNVVPVSWVLRPYAPQANYATSADHIKMQMENCFVENGSTTTSKRINLEFRMWNTSTSNITIRDGELRLNMAFLLETL